MLKTTSHDTASCMLHSLTPWPVSQTLVEPHLNLLGWVSSFADPCSLRATMPHAMTNTAESFYFDVDPSSYVCHLLRTQKSITCRETNRGLSHRQPNSSTISNRSQTTDVRQTNEVHINKSLVSLNMPVRRALSHSQICTPSLNTQASHRTKGVQHTVATSQVLQPSTSKHLSTVMTTSVDTSNKQQALYCHCCIVVGA